MSQESRPQPGLVAAPLSTAGEWLPVFPHPIEGEPTHHLKWTGIYVPVPAMAAAKLIAALHPYALCYHNDDVERRLRKDDLVLVSQSLNEKAQIVVVRTGRKCFLCRRKSRSLVRLANGQDLTGDCVVVGYCVGVLWSPLD